MPCSHSRPGSAGAPVLGVATILVVDDNAKLDIYPEQLARYTALLREEVEASLRVEPGVLTLYQVAEKSKSNRITILEIYASTEAYQAHLRTPHFLKYKTSTAKMVKSLELVTPLVPGVKVK